MTKAEAIAYLQPIADSASMKTYAEALNMAIEALRAQQKPAPLPCKVGDTAYAIRRLSGGVRRIVSGFIAEMYYISSDMALVVRLKNVCRGELGKEVFGTYEEAEAALNKKG